MSRILIFSDNKILCNLWISTLSKHFRIKIISKIDNTIDANAVIIDSTKIDDDHNLLSLFNLPKTHFLIIGTDWPEENQIKALVNGASGYCDESESPTLLVQAVNSILKGDIWIQRHLVPKVIGALILLNASHKEQAKQQIPIESIKAFQSLSSREQDVAEMIRLGKKNKSIAADLNISERTVKAHLTSIFKKLNVSDRLHLAILMKEFS